MDLELNGMPPEAEWKPRYNVAPSQLLAVVTDAEKRIVSWMRWGLIPAWSKGTGMSANGFINARGETASIKPSFRYAFNHRRCLILADGFYEWKHTERKKSPASPFYFNRVDGKPFFFAGLWDIWKPEGGGDIYSGCAIVTCAANSVVSPVHDRMPVMLDPQVGWKWLSTQPPAELNSLLISYPEDKMVTREISRAVNDVKRDDESLLLHLKN